MLLILLLIHQCLAFNGRTSNFPYNTEFLETTKDSSYGSANQNITVHFIEQPLDHFDENVKRTWNMRYYECLDYFKPGGPLLIVANNAFTTDWYFVIQEFTFYAALAQDMNGALFSAGRRYNTVSEIPNENMQELQYHTSKQAIEDIAKLVKLLKSDQRFEKSKVVLLGYDFAGTLAVWLRMKHPELVDAAYVSGAPLLAQIEIPDYYKTVGEFVKNTGPKGCYEAMVSYFKSLGESMKTKEGRMKLHKQFRMCSRSDIESKDVQENFLAKLAKFHADVIQRWELNIYCDAVLNITSGDSCYDYDIDIALERLLEPIHLRERASHYPDCREFGHIRVGVGEPFGEFTSFLGKYTCSVLFGIFDDDLKANVNATNEEYGGLNPNVTQVIFVSGEYDPMRSLTVTKDLSKEAPAIVVKGERGNGDIFLWINTEEVVKTRKIVRDKLKSWLNL